VPCGIPMVGGVGVTCHNGLAMSGQDLHSLAVTGAS
jgi:hypothetical protein